MQSARIRGVRNIHERTAEQGKARCIRGSGSSGHLRAQPCLLATLGYASEVVLQKDKSGIADDAVSAGDSAKATIYMPFAELVDLDKEIERPTKEEEKLKKELARSEGMLSNEKSVQPRTGGKDCRRA